jgi:hypothetical protein
MSIVAVLGEEHDLLRRLAGYLAWDEGAESETQHRLRGDLLVAFCALDRHDELIRSVFNFPAAAEGYAAFAVQELARLRNLREGLIETFHESGEGSSRRRKILIGDLVTDLRSHLSWEEKNLWPLLAELRDPADETAREADARARLAALSDEVLKGGVKLTDSSGRAFDSGGPA